MGNTDITDANTPIRAATSSWLTEIQEVNILIIQYALIILNNSNNVLLSTDHFSNQNVINLLAKTLVTLAKTNW